MRTLVLVSLLTVAVLPAGAITIAGFTPQAGARWETSPTDPISGPFTRNTHAAFVGLGYDFSGVGWKSSNAGSWNELMVTMVSPRHLAQAVHVGDRYSNNTLTFQNADGNVVSRSISGSAVITDIPGTDARLVRLGTAFAPDDKVTFYRLLDTGSTSGAVGLSTLVYGHNNDGGSSFQRRIGRSTITFMQESFANPYSLMLQDAVTTNFVSTYVVGDSGGPTFIPYNNQLVLQGIHYGNGSGYSWDTNWTHPSIYPGINAAMAGDGHALRWTIHTPNARTWTGGADGAFANSMNWLGGHVPEAARSAVFNGAATGNRAILLASPAVARGFLIQAASGTNPFTFSGSTLTLMESGLRNEDADPLTINNSVTLGGSQNWEAANGTITLGGNIDTNGFLVVLSGEQPITLAGSLTGTGSVAWDNPNTWSVPTGQIALTSGKLFVQRGTVVLTSANTYSGGTVVHGGTLLANNSTGSATGSGAVTVANGGAFGGTGSVSGNVTLAAGGGLVFTLSTPPGGHDALAITGTLALGNSPASLALTTSNLAPGIYPLVTANGGITGTLPAVTAPVGYSASLSLSGDGRTLNLTLVSTTFTSYYLSPGGDDTANTGTSPGSPWQTLAKLNSITLQPGDRVFLQGGATFAGPLVVDDSGVSVQPIVFDSYGTGRATIQITSAASGAIAVYNQQHLEFRNLRLVGTAMATSSKPGLDIYADIDRAGLVIDNLEVAGFKSGIEIGAWGGLVGYDNVLIRNCEVHNNRRGGIFTWAEMIGGHTNVTIRDSIAHNNRGEAAATGNTGNGILMSGVAGGLIERCLARDNGDLGFGSVGIWTYQATNVVIQFCEVYNQRAASTSDGGGFDFDGATTNSTIQFCYSHNNDGAGYLFAQYQDANAYGPLSGNTLRYSISKNDGRRRSYGALMFWGSGGADIVGANQVYNNIFYVGGTPTDGTPSAVRFLGSSFSGLKIRNNVFIAADGARVLNADGVTSTAQALFQGNAWWSVSGNTFVIRQGGTTYNSLAAWKAAVSGQEMNGATSLGISVDPLLASPASAGSLATNLADTPNLPALIAALGGFRPQSDSPLINAGLDLTSVAYGSLNVGTRDIAGATLPQGGAYDIGAYDQSPPPVVPVIVGGQSAAGYVGSSFSYGIAANGAPTSFALVSGSLPPGVTLNTATGILSGTPTTAGTHTPGFAATNAVGTSAAVTVSIVVTNGMLLVSEPFNYTLSGTNPDPDGGGAANSGNGLPATNNGGSPSGTSTGLYGSYGADHTVVAGLAYADAAGMLNTSANALRRSSGTGFSSNLVRVYRQMTTDPFAVYRATANANALGWNGVSAQQLYFSVLLHVNAVNTGADNRFVINLGKDNGSYNVYLSQANGTAKWRYGDQEGTGAELGNAVANQTVLIVGRLSFNSATQFVTEYWFNPPLGQAPGAPTFSKTHTTTTSGGQFFGIQTRDGAGILTYDEFRMGTSASAVMPFTPPASGVQTFRSTNGLAADGSQDLLAPAGDGVVNLLKFAFNMVGGGAGQGSALSTPNAATLVPTGIAGLPYAGIEMPAGRLQITFIRRKASSNPGITYAVQFSNDLGVTDPWAVNPSATESVDAIDGTFERVTVTDSAVFPKRSVRVRVTSP